MLKGRGAWKDLSWQEGVVVLFQTMVREENISESRVLSGGTIDHLDYFEKVIIWTALYM